MQGMKEDGNHLWKLRRFKRPAMCNICLQLLVAWGGKQGLSCTREFSLFVYILVLLFSVCWNGILLHVIHKHRTKLITII